MYNLPTKTLALVALVFTFSATTPSRGQILVGPTAGGHLSWINFNDKDYKRVHSNRPTFGYHAGATISFRMLKQVFLQSSILYSREGKNLVGKIDREFQNKAYYSYIKMPISFTKEVRMHFGENRFYNLYFGAGPTVSYWLGGKGTLSSSDLTENGISPPDYVVDYKVTFHNNPEEVPLGEMNVSNANRILLGLNFSAGLVFEPDRLNKVMFTVRYDLGHSFFSQDEDGDFGLDGELYYNDDMQSRHHGIAFSLYYFIDLKTEDKNRGKSTIKVKTNKRKR